MKTEKQRTGREGEDAACLFLTERGHTILERNWRKGHLEVDIISLAPDGLHIIEVKTRRAPVAADPEVNVTGSKRRNLAKAALCFLHSADKRRVIGDAEVFFDILTVVFDNNRTTINYYPKAFIPIYV